MLVCLRCVGALVEFQRLHPYTHTHTHTSLVHDLQIDSKEGERERYKTRKAIESKNGNCKHHATNLDVSVWTEIDVDTNTTKVKKSGKGGRNATIGTGRNVSSYLGRFHLVRSFGSNNSRRDSFFPVALVVAASLPHFKKIKKSDELARVRHFPSLPEHNYTHTHTHTQRNRENERSTTLIYYAKMDDSH